METNFKSKFEIELSITDCFSNKSSEFVNDLSRELKKEDRNSIDPELFRFRDSLINQLYEELLVKDSQLFNGIANPHDFIEEILVEYILSKVQTSVKLTTFCRFKLTMCC